MRRFHLIELEDQSWCPNIIRHSIVETLRIAINLFGFYRETPPILLSALKKSNSNKIIDLCSGCGGPWNSLYKDINTEDTSIDIYLTDINPNDEVLKRLQTKTNNNVRYCAESVSALNIPAEFKGVRTLFSAFHHFEPENAREIIADAVESRQGIAVFEFTARNPLTMLAMITAFAGPLLFVPFMRPFRWTRLIATYLVPIIPIGAAYDGFISCLRTYTVEELEAFTREFSDQGYEWEVGKLKAGFSPFRVTYLIGYPKAND